MSIDEELKKGKFDKTVQVTLEDKRKLKCGTLISQLSIDELLIIYDLF